ncbi:PREDICTED: putative COBW domain-containing protein 7, partial [Pterocles gutturalis]|uniref:putative COBW domain-containing protein 7 n=1 Tax=Pterocles gutturalis TaxID=240206 RepID=UPI00052821B2
MGKKIMKDDQGLGKDLDEKDLQQIAADEIKELAFFLLFRVDLSNVLDLHAFDSLSGISLQKKLEHVKTTRAHLDKGIITVTFEVPGNIKEENLHLFIQNLLWEKNVKDKTGRTMDVIRLKGLVSIQGKSHQVIVQAVHELYDLEETAVAWKEDEKRTNRLVLIGRNLDKETVKEVFIATVVRTESELLSDKPEDM